ncbi:tetratricopeptide repeat protein [Flavobacterium sp.]|uniref:tetratricopeptide repeat protein n=1 Tax=Flavobacterium sp. TaxID=239 RepID=UPI00352800C4
MKNIIYILLLISQTFWAQSVFDKGNEHYRKGNYQEAINAYESILKDKKESCDLYYNLANSYYKLNQIAPAIYYYEKALLISPNDKDIQNNLKFAKNSTIDDIKTIEKVGFEKMVSNFTGLFHYNSWAYISVGLAILFLLFFIGYYFSQTTLVKRIFFIGMFIVPIFILMAVGAAVFEKSRYKNIKPAIVFADVISVKNEPRENATDAFILHEGTKVFVLENVDNWKKIQLTDETEGWILSEAIKELK